MNKLEEIRVFDRAEKWLSEQGVNSLKTPYYLPDLRVAYITGFDASTELHKEREAKLSGFLKKWLEFEQSCIDKDGPFEHTDNYITKEGLDGERGYILAEFFGNNPMWGDNCLDTEFFANCPTDIEYLLSELAKRDAALKEAREALECIITALPRDDQSNEAHNSNYHRLRNSQREATIALDKINSMLSDKEGE